MKEDVIIVLNEREPLKATRAGELEAECLARGFSAIRQKPTREIMDVLLQRRPRLLVLDYLLGDVGTALDLMHKLQKQGEQQSTKCILWTDEPSVSVAVSALKLGALDFIEISGARAVQRALDAVTSALSRAVGKEDIPQASPAQSTNAELIYVDPVSRASHAQATSAANRNCPLVIVHGAKGIGRNSLGRYIHETRQYSGALHEIDFDLWDGASSDIFGSKKTQRKLALIEYGATVILDHLNQESGEILEAAEEFLNNRFPAQHYPMLIIGTSCIETVRAWQRLTEAEVIEIPSLEQRGKDLLPLLQQLCNQAAAWGFSHKLELNPKLLDEILKRSWPGNIRQLKAAVLEGLTTPLETKTAAGRKKGTSDASISQEKLWEAIWLAADRWERYQVSEKTFVEPVIVRRVMASTGGNTRIAAARLGTSIAQIKKTLGVAADG